MMTYLTSARENDVEKLKSMINEGMSPEASNPFGFSALHIAALSGSVEAVSFLLSAGCSPNLLNKMMDTPLHCGASAKTNNMEVCKLLIDAGADLHAVNRQGTEPFENAATQELRTLLGGPDQRIFDCCADGNAAALKKLLDDGEVTNLFVYDLDGDTPLNIAIRSNNQELVKTICGFNQACARQSDRVGSFPIHVAVEEGDVEMIKLILSYGPDVNVPNMNASEYAAGSWQLKGEDLEPFDKTALHLAVEGGDCEVAKLILDAGAALDELDFDRSTPLHHALEMQDVEMMDLLIEAGADINIPHPDFSTPLHLTAYQGSLAILEKLIAAGANVNAVAAGDEATPLLYAARTGKLEKVRALLKAGADVKAVNVQGDSALHLAAVNGHKAVVEALLAEEGAGEMKGQANKDGKSPADLAKTAEIKQLLKA